ncbi:MAG TPA: pyruvate dehydrogenase (acetyl-transferring), homodimeric type [Vicinamibacterales bacterium]|nr:pyruvate dehydrogenase (acetyl-transferring), homodimeric type [Vicinamibacterales bacterium]
MTNIAADNIDDLASIETKEWLDSLDYVLQANGPARAGQLLQQVSEHARRRGIRLPFSANTPYINTLTTDQEVAFPGSQEIERRIKSLVRWNAIAMVVRANRLEPGIGGHISTFASAATLYEVGFNHFFRASGSDGGRDVVYYQGHAAPGIYSRAFLEGRLSEKQLDNFRRELASGGGLSSYPHPWLMPDFWEYPTVSMGLGPIMAIYQARFIRYLEDRGLKTPSNSKVWAFLGDGETDEPESLGAITLPAREKLDNLIFVVNCNLQRLDGPVRGNGQIIQELEAVFRGAGWNVIKVLWGKDWDPLLAKDKDGLLVKRMGEIVDGEYQKYTVEPGSYLRQQFWGKYPKLLEMVKHLSDDELKKLTLGGHDPIKVYNAYKAAVEHKGQPTVLLIRTIKGYGLGEAAEGKNITHQQKKLNEDELRAVRERFSIPVAEEKLSEAPYYRPDEKSPEVSYLKERRKALGGSLPFRTTKTTPLSAPPNPEIFEEFSKGTDGRAASTTMVFVRLLSKMLRDPELGKLVVPIVPDEARTFGMEALFRQVGIYSHVGQLYEPVDMDTLLYYKESTDGQILEEGINEAGSLSSFIAAGTAYSIHGVNTIPFFIYYSMFGFQRVGDLIWAAADSRCRGFLLGGTAGRTTLAGEGLQHQDGNTQLLAYPVPNCLSYDPAFAYELAVIIENGIKRMYVDQESIFYYLTVMNEQYAMPPMPQGEDVRSGIVKGMYRYSKAKNTASKLRAQLLGSGAILPEVIKAAGLLEQFGVAADVWSVTSYGELYRDGNACDRWNMLHPSQKARVPYIAECLNKTEGVIVAASDYLKALPNSVDRWLQRPIVSLGTDGFGRSEGRQALREFFEVDARFIAVGALSALARDKHIDAKLVEKAIKDLGIDPEKKNPAIS